jgi:hypothetical protein
MTDHINISQLIQEVSDLRQRGIKTVDLDKLEPALIRVKNDEETTEAWARLITDLEHQSKLAILNANAETKNRQFESVISFASNTLKSALMINGGASVALLAFLGTQKPTNPRIAASALLFFSIGVLLAALGCATSYLAQYYYAEYAYTDWGQTGEDRKKYECGEGWRKASIVTIIASFLAFFAGTIASYQCFFP